MATMAGAIHQSRKPMKSVSVPVFGAVSGTLLMFRFLAPQPGKLSTNEEIMAFQGGEPEQTDHGNTYGHTARPPRAGYQVPRGSV
ncbi:unnamed protein product [Penicillium glandicola]